MTSVLGSYIYFVVGPLVVFITDNSLGFMGGGLIFIEIFILYL